MDGLTISQLAERARVTLGTIRFYEREGLLPKALRTASGYRSFSEGSIGRLAFVKRAKALDFFLGEIRERIQLQSESAGACAEMRDLLQVKLSLVRKKREELETLESHLSHALRKCNRVLKEKLSPGKTCPVLRQVAEPVPYKCDVQANGVRRNAARGR